MTEAAEHDGILDRVARLEYLTVGWNLLEGTIAVLAAVKAHSIALLGFGIDSFVEMSSGVILLWRVRAERRAATGEHTGAAERRARRLVAGSLFVLAFYVAVDACLTLWKGTAPETSWVGLVLLVVSLGIMRWLARAKREAATQWGSRALAADAVQTDACWWLSVIALAGLALNAAFHWWWADPVAALGMTWFLVREGREAWEGEDCCP